MEQVHVAVIGDKGIGKTSLILAAAKKALSDAPVPTLQTTRLEVQCGSSGTVECLCHDTDSSEQEETRAVIRRCNVVLVCFAMDRPASVTSALQIWLPMALKCIDQTPIVLVGCKQDVSVMSDADIQVCKS